jgi:hypothetical protein
MQIEAFSCLGERKTMREMKIGAAEWIPFKASKDEGKRCG